jgi:hypothetical protein
LPDLPANCGPERLRAVFSAVRPLTRGQLRKEQARLLAREGDVSSWRRIATTGTTGEPVEVVLDEAARAAEVALFGDHVDRVLGSGSWRSGNVFHLALHPGATSRSMPSPWGPGRSLKWNLIRAWQSSDEVFAECLGWVDGTIAALLPSVALLICERLRRTGHAPKARPVLVILSGERIEPSVRVLVGETLDCPVTTFYSLAEAGIVGMDCGDGRYRADESRVIVEILKEDGTPTTAGVEGEIVVTPLDNLALPLLRYKTGDRGMWVEAPGSGAPHAGCFALTGARQPKALLTGAGASVNVVRFAKVLAALPVDRFDLGQLPDATVVFTYSAASALDDLSYSIVVSVLRGAMGPDCRVLFQRVSTQDVEGGTSGSAQVACAVEGSGGPTEPEGPGIDEVARWLKGRLSHESGIDLAALIGSALDPESTTRFSDLDVVILVHGDPAEPRWMALYRSLRESLPKLSANFDRAGALEQRAPLVACRLLSEGRTLIGSLGEWLVPWPAAEVLRSYGVFWAQDAIAALWHRLAAVGRRSSDPIHEAWLASKYCLDALRLRHLLQGGRSTRARDVVAAARVDAELRLPWFEIFIEALSVSREHQPPLRSDSSSQAFLEAALSCVRCSAEAFARRSHDGRRARTARPL